MKFLVAGTPGKVSEDVSFPPAPTPREAWDNAIDLWKGVPTRDRPYFRAQAYEAMQSDYNGYRLETVQ